MARISVLIGIYNCASTLVEALDSLYAQTYQDFKIILCEDGSSDDTYEVARRYAEEHDNIVLLRNEHNMGLNYTLNRCLEHADTEYIARMDGDDISVPERFEKEINFLDAHTEYALVSCPMIYFDDQGTYKGSSMEATAEKREGREPSMISFRMSSPFCHAPCMIRTAVIKEVGGYTVAKRLLRVEDYDLWTKIYAAGYKGFNLAEPLYMMRDDRNAAHRRTLSARWNSTRARLHAYRVLGFPLKWYPYAFVSVGIGLMPQWLYKAWRERRYQKRQKRRQERLQQSLQYQQKDNELHQN